MEVSEALSDLLGSIASSFPAILGENLVGIYQWGSLTYDAFDPRCRDVDLIVVTRRDLDDGASAAQVAQTVLGEGLRVTAIGMAIGSLLTMTLGQWLSQRIQLIGDQFQRRDTQAYQVSDLPWMLAAVAAMLTVLTLLACWVPLRKALAVDPVRALRAE
jgi:hypothetical protein